LTVPRTTLDLDLDGPRNCSRCGWSGTAGDAIELFESLVDLRCPKCDEKVGPHYLHPTGDEIRAAAAAGNAKAIAMLAEEDVHDDRERRFAATKLETAAALPDVPGDAPFAVTWDLERDGDGEDWIVLRVAEQVLWRELAHFEDLPRLQEVARLLVERYRGRVLRIDVAEDGDAMTYLLGDKLGWIDGPERVNAWIAGRRS
jgi:hypothetical protein